MGGLQEEPSGFKDPAESVEHLPQLSKYNVFAGPSVTLYCADIDEVFGVARRSAATEERMAVATVCEIDLWFVCIPTGSKPKTAIKQKPAIPRARVTSTRENASAGCKKRFLVEKFFCSRPI